MTDVVVAGALAGLGVAIPVGAIAVLIIETTIRHGYRVGWAAGAGAATADGTYALLAAIFGTAIAALLAPWTVPLRLASAALLVAIAVRGLLRLRRPADESIHEDPPTMRRAYLLVLGLTAINPMTVTYFAALVLGLTALAEDPGSRLVFGVSAFIASLAWQSVVAGIGAIVHHTASARVRTLTSILGSVIVLAFAVLIVIDTIQP
ncbi:MAG TPA: LysE family transporter [Candidatus Limnocylindrales bacterium]|jgi:threonine/homoserine/homoserine lactone efflux protein